MWNCSCKISIISSRREFTHFCNFSLFKSTNFIRTRNEILKGCSLTKLLTVLLSVLPDFGSIIWNIVNHPHLRHHYLNRTKMLARSLAVGIICCLPFVFFRNLRRFESINLTAYHHILQRLHLRCSPLVPLGFLLFLCLCIWHLLRWSLAFLVIRSTNLFSKTTLNCSTSWSINLAYRLKIGINLRDWLTSSIPWTIPGELRIP